MSEPLKDDEELHGNAMTASYDEHCRIVEGGAEAAREYYALREDAERWRAIRAGSCVVSSGPRGPYYLTTIDLAFADGMPTHEEYADAVRRAIAEGKLETET